MPGKKWEIPTSKAYKKKMKMQENNGMRVQETEKAKQRRLDEKADEAYDELIEDMDPEDIEYMQQMNNKSNKRSREDSENSDDDDAMEKGALKRIHAELDDEEKQAKSVKQMLPVKTKDGWKDRRVKVEAGEESEAEVEDENEGEEDGGSDKEEEIQDKVTEDISAGDKISVIELYTKRKEMLNEMKIKIGSLASTFLEDPQNKMSHLEKLIKLVDMPQADSIRISVQRLAAASVLECLKDVTPGYRIFHQTAEKRQKQETIKLQGYENDILKNYKAYLLKLEKYVNYFKMGKKKQPKDELTMKQAECFLTYMCDLLLAHPTFNFSFNILHAITPVLDSNKPNARLIVKKTIEQVFKSDMRGEISKEATRLINHLVKSRKHEVNLEAIDVLKALRIKDVNLDKEKERDIQNKKLEYRKRALHQRATCSRKQKKQNKKMADLEKELLESKGEESKQTKERFFTDATKIVFTIYFRVLKSFPKSSLMGAVLEGLAKFAHLINIEFFGDLVSVFQHLLQTDFLTNRDGFLMVNTVFNILSGQGEILNIDPSSFYTHMYKTLFSIDCIRSQDDLPLALNSIYDMVIKRKKRVSKGRTLAFAKRLCTLSLQMLHNGSASSLALVREISNNHANIQQLLDSEHEVGSGVFDPLLENPEHCSASNTTAWELSLLHYHYHQPTARLADHIASMCPVTGVAALSLDLKKSHQEIYQNFSMDEMSFNPPIRPPSSIKTKRRHFTPTTLQLDIDSIDCDTSIDFYSHMDKSTTVESPEDHKDSISSKS